MGEEKAANGIAGAIEFAVKAIAVGVPVFYALGRLFLDGYWSYFGLSPSLMAPNAEDYLYFGFLSVLLPLARLVGVGPYTPMGYAVLVAFGLAVFVVVARMASAYWGPWFASGVKKVNGWLMSWAQERAFAARQTLLFVSVWSFVSFILMGVVAGLIVLILPLALAVHEGTYQAKQADNQLRRPVQGRAHAFADFEGDKALHSAPLLECSERWCVVLKDSAYLAVPAESVVRVRVVKATHRPGE